MSKHCSNTNLAVGLAVAVLIWTIGPTGAPAQAAQPGHQHAEHTGHDHGHGSGIGGDAGAAHRSPHGGQMTVAGPLSFEAVYRPKQTRLYLYGADHRPLSAKGVQGRVVMNVRGHEKAFPFPLAYVAPQAGSTGGDFLAAVADVSRVRDGDMTVTFELANLPNPAQSRAAFTQTFALSKLPVVVAPLDESDRAGIARQKVCPVSGGKLGSMGTPLKVLIGDQPVYLCCKGCLGKIQEKPELYLQKVAPAGRIAVTTATAADEAAIAQQRLCPVSGGKLGSMGAPLKVLIGDQRVYLCCKGCLGKVEKNPNQYLAKAAELRAGR